jgi:hypothetical protein
VAFVDGEIVARSAEGEIAVWGTVTRWEPAVPWRPPGIPGDAGTGEPC